MMGLVLLKPKWTVSITIQLTLNDMNETDVPIDVCDVANVHICDAFIRFCGACIAATATNESNGIVDATTDVVHRILTNAIWPDSADRLQPNVWEFAAEVDPTEAGLHISASEAQVVFFNTMTTRIPDEYLARVDVRLQGCTAHLLPFITDRKLSNAPTLQFTENDA